MSSPSSVIFPPLVLFLTATGLRIGESLAVG